MMKAATVKRGLFAPLQRDRKRDFASASGRKLLHSKVIQVLMTEGQTARTSGELPWRTSLGSGLHLLRHQRNDDVLRELALVRVREALARWLPDIEVTELRITRNDSTLTLRLRYRAAGARAEETAEVNL